MSKLFDNFKEPSRKTEGQDFRIEIAQDFERLQSDSKAYFFLMKRISDLKDVAHLHVMNHAGEDIAKYWKGQLQALDEVLSIPEMFAIKGREANEETKLKSVV